MDERALDERAKNLAYALFRLMGGWLSRQCCEVTPTYTREALLADLEKNIREAMRQSAPDWREQIRAAGGDAWDKVADPEKLILENRGDLPEEGPCPHCGQPRPRADEHPLSPCPDPPRRA